jgi:predicted DNA-binding protein
MKSNPTSFRLSIEARRLLAALSDKLGVSQSSVLEILIRDRAKAERVK